MAMSKARTHDLRDSVYIGALSLAVAFMSSTFVIRVVHTSITSAGWEDSLDSNDPVSSMVAMIAISSVVYSLLTRIKNRYGLIASFEGACWLIGSVPILFWIIHQGRVLPDISDFPYLGSLLVIAAVFLHVLRSRTLKSARRSSGDMSQVGDDSEVAEESGNDRTPHQPMASGQQGKSRARRWMLGVAAGAAIVVAALIPRSFPLLDTESAANSEDDCRPWYDSKVVALYKGRLALWVEWSKALKAFVNSPEKQDEILADPVLSASIADLIDQRSTVSMKHEVAQDDLDLEIEIAFLGDDYWDADEMKSIAAVRIAEMQALMDALTLEFILADAVGFYPFPDSEGLETDLRMAALGLERACGL